MPTTMIDPGAPGPLEDGVLSGLAAIPTTILSDASAGRLLMDPNVRALRQLGNARLCGPAVTAWCEPADIGAALHAISRAKPGDVLVIDAGGSLQSAVVGEHLCGVARRNGVAGLVANGAVRDVATLAEWADFPVFAVGRTARGPVSVERGTVNGPIVCGGLRVNPFDIIVGDDDGVVVIPRADAAHWLSRARDRLAVEQEWDRRLTGGETLLEVFGLTAP